MIGADARLSLGPNSVRFAEKGVAGTGCKTAVGYGWLVKQIQKLLPPYVPFVKPTPC